MALPVVRPPVAVFNLLFPLTSILQQAPNYFDRLPDELVEDILQLAYSRTASQYLTWPDIALVCRRFRNIITPQLFRTVCAPSRITTNGSSDLSRSRRPSCATSAP